MADGRRDVRLRRPGTQLRRRGGGGQGGAEQQEEAGSHGKAGGFVLTRKEEVLAGVRGCVMLRPTVPEDTPLLLALTEQTGMFKPMEVQALREVFDDYFAFERDNGHFGFTEEQDGRLVGFTYY